MNWLLGINETAAQILSISITVCSWTNIVTKLRCISGGRKTKKVLLLNCLSLLSLCIGISAACLSQLAQCPVLVFLLPRGDCPDNNITVLGFQDGDKTVWGHKWKNDIAGGKTLWMPRVYTGNKVSLSMSSTDVAVGHSIIEKKKILQSIYQKQAELTEARSSY